MSEDLVLKHCVPCESGVPPLTRARAEAYLREAPGWAFEAGGKRISREWKLANFRAALAFVNRVAELAEEEGHHPDIRLFGYCRVRLELSTHAIGGLSENDFVLAVKINEFTGAPTNQERKGKLIRAE